jgi:uncharacterized protein (TIGR02118 family)
MPKFVAMYTRPDDVEAFEDHYRTVHVPIMDRWPNVESTEITRGTGTPRGTQAPFHLITTIRFATAEGMQQALTSEAGSEAARDAMGLAKRFGIEVTMLLGEDF